MLNVNLLKKISKLTHGKRKINFLFVGNHNHYTIKCLMWKEIKIDYQFIRADYWVL